MSKEGENNFFNPSKISFDDSGRYELEDIVDHDFLQLVGGAGGAELNAKDCGDKETNDDCDTNYVACTNTPCNSEDGDNE